VKPRASLAFQQILNAAASLELYIVI